MKRAKAIHCKVRFIDESGDRLELIQRKHSVDEAPAEVQHNFLLAVSDRESIFSVDSKVYNYNPGDLMFFRPGQLVGYKTTRIPAAGTIYRGLELSVQTVERVLGSTQISRYGYPCFRQPILTDEAFSGDLSSIHSEMLDCQSKEGTEELIQALMKRILDHSKVDGQRTARTKCVRPEIRRVAQFIHEHYHEQLTLEQLAEVARLSTSRFSHVFADSIGAPPHQYILQYRVHRAKTLLSRSTPISQTATETGFVDQAHLTRHFKRLTALTPGQYASRRKSEARREAAYSN